MITLLLLFTAGLILVAVEILVPGGLLGILGGLCLAGGVVVAFKDYGSVGGSIATGVALLIGGFTLYFEFVILPKTGLARKFSMGTTMAARSQPEIADRSTVIGREAVTRTLMAPSGYVELDGRRYEAFCRSGQVPAGARVRVADVDNFRLVVTQIKESS